MGVTDYETHLQTMRNKIGYAVDLAGGGSVR